MAMTPREEATYALDFGVSRRDLSPVAQVEYDRLIAEGYGTERREQFAREKAERDKRIAGAVWLPHLGVAVYDGNVHQHGKNQSGTASDRWARAERREGLETKLLGALAGAHAETMGGKGGTRRSDGARVADALAATAVLHSPVGLLAGVSRTGFRGFAVVTFAGGSFWEKGFIDQASLVKAQAEAVRFNAMAGASSPTITVTGNDPAARLRKLQELLDEGLLNQDEYESKRVEIIDSI